MSHPLTIAELKTKRCGACEGGVPPLSSAVAQSLVAQLPGWSITPDGKRIKRIWKVLDFMSGIDFFNRVATLAEDEGHHPDLQLEGYRNLRIELWTHAIDGLSENDFILAAKINDLPLDLKT